MLLLTSYSVLFKSMAVEGYRHAGVFCRIVTSEMDLL